MTFRADGEDGEHGVNVGGRKREAGGGGGGGGGGVPAHQPRNADAPLQVSCEIQPGKESTAEAGAEVEGDVGSEMPSGLDEACNADGAWGLEAGSLGRSLERGRSSCRRLRLPQPQPLAATAAGLWRCSALMPALVQTVFRARRLLVVLLAVPGPSSTS